MDQPSVAGGVPQLAWPTRVSAVCIDLDAHPLRILHHRRQRVSHFSQYRDTAIETNGDELYRRQIASMFPFSPAGVALVSRQWSASGTPAPDSHLIALMRFDQHYAALDLSPSSSRKCDFVVGALKCTVIYWMSSAGFPHRGITSVLRSSSPSLPIPVTFICEYRIYRGCQGWFIIDGVEQFNVCTSALRKILLREALFLT